MSNSQHYQNVAIIILVVLALCAIYLLATAVPVTMPFHSNLVAGIKWCFSAADYVQELGEGPLRDWQTNIQYKLPISARPPLHIAYAYKSSRFAADVLREAGSFLAAKVISHRNYGSSNPFLPSPARIVLATRSLFLPDEVLRVSFTPTWVPNVWSKFSLT